MNRVTEIILLTFILVIGLLLIFKSPIWSPIDEGAHFAYIETIVREKRLPILKKDYISWQVLSIDEKKYPQKTETDPKKVGLGGCVYEAFQPPLYYLAAAPIFLLGGENYYTKIGLLRFFGFLQYLVVLYLVYKIFKKFNLSSYLFFILALLPGFLLRSITISNAITEILIWTFIFYFMATRMADEDGAKKILILATLTGLAILTKITSVFLIPAILLWLTITKRKFKPLYGLFVIIPLLMLSPWLYWNWQNYHSLTPNKLAIEMQTPVIDPKGELGGAYILKNLDQIFHYGFVFAQEQGVLLAKSQMMRVTETLFVLLFILVAIYALIKTIKVAISTIKKRQILPEEKCFLLSSLFFLSNLAALFWIAITWAMPPTRHLYPTLAALFIVLKMFLDDYVKKGKIRIVYFILILTVVLSNLVIIANLFSM